jgi:GTP-binding protein HflX
VKSPADPAKRVSTSSGLAAAIGVEVVERKLVRVREPRASTLMGKGQVEAIANDVAAHEANWSS